MSIPPFGEPELFRKIFLVLRMPEPSEPWKLEYRIQVPLLACIAQVCLCWRSSDCLFGVLSKSDFETVSVFLSD